MSRSRFLILATLFQGGLLLLGLGLSTGLGISLTFDWSGSAWGRGIATTVPMLILFWYSMKSERAVFRDLRDILTDRLGPLLSSCSVLDLFYLSVLAGVSEEILFRGALQNILLGMGILVSLGVTNLIFGLCHAVSWSYFCYAILAGLYLSWVAGYPDQNLSSAIITHSLYDLIALYVVQTQSRQQLTAENNLNSDQGILSEEAPPEF